MNEKGQARLTAGLALACAFLLGGMPLCGQTSPTQPAASKPGTTEEAYKNIQVLKGLPGDQLIPAMQFITSSLGVECSFCHVEGAFEKDDKKPKQVARKMMQMMFVINQQNFEGKREVTCYSCHRGSAHPVATPIIAEAGTLTVLANLQNEDGHGSVPPAGPQAEQIFARYLEALGGAPAIEKLTSRVEKGTINLSGRQFPIDIFSKVPDKRVSIIHLPNGDNITAYAGASGWTSAPNRQVREIPASEVASARAEADLQLPIHVKQLFSELRMGKPEKIGDHDVYVVSGLNAREPAVKFYFDEHSGLLLRVLRYADSPLGRNPTQIDCADYRDQNGVKVPFQRTIARPNSRFSIQIEEAHDNVPVDDAKFARPAEPSPAKPPSP
jgi:photosynthetic reaction center cytochrome c subunit